MHSFIFQAQHKPEICGVKTEILTYPNTRTNLMMLHILSVDDSKLIKNVITTILGEIKGVKHVGHAFDLSEAYSIISSQKTDIVLLDINLNQESGFGLLEFIKEKHPELIVIMVSNLATDIYRKKSLELGAHYFIDKTNELEKLTGLIEMLLNNHQADKHDVS